jgi:glycosyltransferase involved in cell wall biosynthesis
VVKIDPATLPRRANIHWLGSKSYTQLPEYLAHWDAGFMPFALNAATRFISPTKTPEFLAAGVPVVSTPIRDVVRPYGDEGLVGISGDPAAFEGVLAEAMQRPRTDWLAAVDRRLAGMSWDRTYLRMAARMEEAKAAARAGATAVATGRSLAIAAREVAGV